MRKKSIIVLILSLVAILLYTGCDRDSDGEETAPRAIGTLDLTKEMVPKHFDPVFDTLVCYPVGTTWEMGYYFFDDVENLYLRSKFKVVSDTLIDNKHYKKVKGEFVHLDKTLIPEIYNETWGMWPGIENDLHRLDFYIYEDKGVVTAYGIDKATQRPAYFFQQYDFNWPPYIHGLLIYSDGNIVEAEIPRSSLTLLDGNIYEIEDYRVYTSLMEENKGYREYQNAFLVKTIGCIYAMFGMYCDHWLKGRLLNFRRNGELLYEYGKVELPEKKLDDYYHSPLEKAPDLIGTWSMVEFNNMPHKEFTASNQKTEYEAGAIEWTFYPECLFYVKSDSSVAYVPFVYSNGTHRLDYATDTQLCIDDVIYDYSLGDDGVLTINRETSNRYYSCTFKKKR